MVVPPLPARAGAYVEWLDGTGASAQALADDDLQAAEREAARALSARTRGVAGARAQLASGLALRAVSKHEAAARALDGVADRLPPVLAAHARFERAEALLSTGHAGEAAAALSALASAAPGPLAARAQRRAADALLAAGDPRRAAAAYQALVAAPATPADRASTERGGTAGARLALANALRTAGEDRLAAAAYRELWLELPADPAGRAAGRALAEWARRGGPVPPATPDEQLARAERLVLLAHPRRALVALDRLPALAGERGADAALLRALALGQLGRTREAAESARRADVPGAAAGTRSGARMVLARTAAREGRVDEAIARYAALAHEPAAAIPGVAPAAARDLPDDAAYLAAWLLLDAGRFAPAAKALHRYALDRPSSRRAVDARWFEAWALYRLGRTVAARRAFERLERGPLAPAALYWRARIEPPGRSRALYYRAIGADPGGWYALLAVSRLAAMGDRAAALSPVRAAPPPESAGEGTAADALTRATLLLGAGLREEALAELRGVAVSPAARAAAVPTAQLAAAAGDAELPFRIARDHLALTSRTVRWAYPDAYSRRLPALAAQAGIDRWLLLAVLRRESAFRPDARSPAGAEGLVQLLPATAERLARVLGVPAGRARHLDDPEVSLTLGAAYLALLEDRFRDPAGTLAAYNGGPAPAAAWAKAHAARPVDEAVEEIPFRETRRYVKSVLAARAVYGWLWNGERLVIDPGRPVRTPRAGVAF